MGLDTALSVATSGLANINAQFATVSQNVANASTPGYAAEISSQQAIAADGVGMGVRTGSPTLQIDQALQTALTQQNATTSGLQTTQAALQSIDSALGTPGAGNDLSSLVGNLQDSFSTLFSNPGDQTKQNSVVTSATTLAQGINMLSATYSAQRQGAQNDLGSAVDTLNTTLENIGQLSNQIIALKPTNQGTADLENQRNAAIQSISKLLDIKVTEQPSGDVSLFSAGGMSLPTRAVGNTFSFLSSSAPVGSFYPGGGVPGITLNGVDVTKQLTGGQIGADVMLRDNTLPTYQGELDEFAQGLSNRFAAQGLALFSDPLGNVPTGGGVPAQAGYIGYASTIQVNPAVTANLSLVRDGTAASASTGFIPNPPGGPSGFTALVSNILNYTFGAQASSGSPQPAMITTALGPTGGLSASFNAMGGTLADFATNLVSSQAQQSAAISTRLSTEQALQSSLNTKMTAVSGVNMDTEMSHMLSLQQAYSANARVIAAIQSMFTQLLQAVQ